MKYPPGTCLTKTYIAWKDMRRRCLLPTTKGYARYGGRGIAVCDRWDSYFAFLEDMGEAPEGHSLDRIDNDGNYEPSNCRWLPISEQQTNSSNVRRITYLGKTLTTMEWERSLGLSHGALWHRLKNGWSMHDALTLPRGQKP